MLSFIHVAHGSSSSVHSTTRRQHSASLVANLNDSDGAILSINIYHGGSPNAALVFGPRNIGPSLGSVAFRRTTREACCPGNQWHGSCHWLPNRLRKVWTPESSLENLTYWKIHAIFSWQLESRTGVKRCRRFRMSARNFDSFFR